MQGMLTAIIVFSITARLIKFVLPDNSGIRKYASMLLGLCLTAVLAIPIADIVSGIGEITISPPDIGSIEDDYSEIFDEYIADSLYPSVEEYIYRVLEEKFSIVREDAEVFIRFDTDGDVISLEQILIFLRGKAVFADTGAITDYFEEKLTCKTDVSVDIP